MLPESPWTPPTELPDLRGRSPKYFSIDIESRDPNLKEKGPGFVRGDAYVVGVAIKCDQYKQYFPVRHAQGDNLAPNVFFPWLEEQLGGDEPKIGANLLYDLEGLWYSGVRDVRGKLLDVQVAEPLLDEDSQEGYSLDVLARKWLNKTKNEELLRKVARMYSTAFKGKKAVPMDPKSGLWTLPPQYVGPYAEEDVELPVQILEEQLREMTSQSLMGIFELESKLTRVLLHMRLKGSPVDLEKAHALVKYLKQREDEASMELIKLAGFDLNVNSADDLAHVYRRNRVEFKRTKTGRPSFPAEWLEAQNDPFSLLVRRKRKLLNLRNNFVQGDIIDSAVRGRVHAQWHQLREDEAGTRSGRLSSTHPNLTQVPARDKEFAPLVRGLFVAEDGMQYYKGDYSQQEPRLFIHYAYKMRLPGAAEAVATFKRNPKTDYHQFTTETVNRVSGKNFARGSIKGINLGIMYVMGAKKMAVKLGISLEDCLEILNDYHGALPFVKPLITRASNAAMTNGKIRTILGRLSRFDLWEPVRSPGKDPEEQRQRPLPLDEAKRAWPNVRLQRAHTHKAVNRLIQGSAADQTKEATNILFYEHGKVPHLLVHDELTGSVADDDEARLWKNVQEEAVLLELPVVCEAKLGPSWGETKREVLAI